MNCLILVSDEGYGHTVRQSCVANELVKRGSDATLQCKDPVPLAAKIVDRRVKIHEHFNLLRLVKGKGGIDIESTYNLLQDYVSMSAKWIDQMINSPHVLNCDLIVTDIVEEAGLLSKKLAKPAIAISHFTWHWLLRKLDSRFEDVSQYLETSLEGVLEFLYTPFSKCPEQFPKAKPIHLITRRPRNRDEVRRELQLRKGGVLVLLAGGGTSVWKGLFSSTNVSKRKGLVMYSDLPASSSAILRVPIPHRLHDYINAADLVISRGGYGTLSETVAYGIRHLVLVERDHPEAAENARMLKEANRAMVAKLDDFLADPYEAIDEALGYQADLAPMKSDGHIQAVDRLFEIWQEYRCKA